MITKKKLIIPIFEYRLTVIIFDKWEELRPYIPEDEMDIKASAITIGNTMSALVAINSRSDNSIIHEAEHIKNAIWRDIGYEPQRDNDEVDAYLIAYIVKRLYEVFFKHDSKS